MKSVNKLWLVSILFAALLSILLFLVGCADDCGDFDADKCPLDECAVCGNFCYDPDDKGCCDKVLYSPPLICCLLKGGGGQVARADEKCCGDSGAIPATSCCSFGQYKCAAKFGEFPCEIDATSGYHQGCLSPIECPYPETVVPCTGGTNCVSGACQ